MATGRRCAWATRSQGMKALVEEAAAFDLVFFDADKARLADYLAEALKLSRPGTVLIFDNVVRDGRVVEDGTGDGSVEGVRALTASLAGNPRIEATALQTVGAKGYDGFLLAMVSG